MTSLEPSPASPTSKLRAYLELLRAPNLFTAAADVLMGFLVTHDEVGAEDGPMLAALVGASVLSYAAGVVLNDVFDYPSDVHERPYRPLPSGRISLGAARWLGWQLLLVGAALAWGAGYLAGHWRPGIVGTALAGAVILYDAFLKRTAIGPVAMGACRMLNVLLGMSAMQGAWPSHLLVIAGGIGVYVAGLTWFARGETSRSPQLPLALATGVMLLGIGLLAWFPAWIDPMLGEFLKTDSSRWYLVMALLGAWIGWQCLRAVLDPDPAQVQQVVKQRILSLVILDGFACFALRGPSAAVLVVLLLVPAAFLGSRVSST